MATNNNQPKRQRTERAARNDFVRVCSYVALVLSALLLFINKLLPVCGVEIQLGTVGRVLDFICYLALLIGIVFGAWSFARSHKRVWFIIFIIAVVVYIVALVLIFF